MKPQTFKPRLNSFHYVGVQFSNNENQGIFSYFSVQNLSGRELVNLSIKVQYFYPPP